MAEYDNNLKELLREKITLWEASKLFSEEKVKLRDIVASFYSFQSLEEINRVMSIILGQDFIRLIGSRDTKDYIPRNKMTKSFVLDRDDPEWKSDLSELFDLRHNFVHHTSKKRKLSQKQLNRVINPVLFVIMTMLHSLQYKNWDKV